MKKDRKARRAALHLRLLARKRVEAALAFALQAGVPDFLEDATYTAIVLSAFHRSVLADFIKPLHQCSGRLGLTLDTLHIVASVSRRKSFP